MTNRADLDILTRIGDEIRRRQRFVLTSHVRPDGDAIGSQMAMAYALRSLGKQVRIVNHDAPPPPMLAFPGVETIEVAASISDPDLVDAVMVMECGDLSRTGLTGLERHFIINIDHHPGNANYGTLNWFDGSAAACGEMVFDLITALGLPLTREAATHIYLAILTDTGSFHYSSISPRTFDICRQALEAGIDPGGIARGVYDTNSIGRLRLFSAVLHAMQLDAGGRLAILYMDHDLERATGGQYDDTDGLINVPLTVREIQAVVFFKHSQAEEYRVSMRSKGDIDVSRVAKRHEGGGHKNAAGCTVVGPFEDVRGMIVNEVLEELSSSIR